MNRIITFIFLLFLTSCDNKTESSAPNSQANAQSTSQSTSHQKKSHHIEGSELKNGHTNVDTNIKKESKPADPNLKTASETNGQSNENTSNLKEINFSLRINENDVILGNKMAKVTLIEYFSPTCPHCAAFKKNIFPELKKQFVDTKKIAYIMREFIANKQDLDAALLARCEENDESFLKFTSLLLDQQDTWAVSSKYREILTNIGQIGGILPEKYASCLKSDKLAKILINNSKIATQSKGFYGTPAFFINGIQYDGPNTLMDLSKAIETALKKEEVP